MTGALKVGRRPLVSPLRYPGGKGALYPRLRWLIREMGLAGGTYVEPYAGGAGAGLALLLTGQVDSIVINDLDPAMYAFWKSVTHDPNRYIDELQSVPLNVDEWRRQREIYSSNDSSDLFALGFATFYLNRTNVSGVLNGGPIGRLDQTGKYKIDARFNKDGLAERFRLIGLYADAIAVTNVDGAEVIRTYAPNPDAFIYADPPYFEKAGSLYLNSFRPQDHATLAQALNEAADSNWVLTYDHVPQVEDLYPDRQRVEFTLNYSAHRVVKATELAVFSLSLIHI